MNRSFKTVVWGAALMAAAVAAPAYAELKIGVLDYGRLMDESPQGKVLLESLRSEAASKQRELQGTAQSLQTKQDKLNKDRATRSAVRRRNCATGSAISRVASRKSRTTSTRVATRRCRSCSGRCSPKCRPTHAARTSIS